MSEIRKDEGPEPNRLFLLVSLTVAAGLAVLLLGSAVYLIGFFLFGGVNGKLSGVWLAVYLVVIGVGTYNWEKLYPEQKVYLSAVIDRLQERRRALVARALAGPTAYYRYCTGSYLGAAIGAIPFGIAIFFGVFYFSVEGRISISCWEAIIVSGVLMGIVLGPLFHSEKRLHLRWFWVPSYTIIAFFIVALIGEGLLRAASFWLSGIEYGNGMAHWWDVRVGIDWWGVWFKRGLGFVAAIYTFIEESKKGSGARAQLVWSLKTARNGLLTIGEVGGEGWRVVRELLFAGLAGGAWWLAWHFGLACYQVDIAPWHIAATVAITLAAIPFIAFKAGMALEHLMRAGAAIVPPADPRPPVTPRMTGTGTVWDADAAGGPRKGPTIDDLDF